MPPSQGQASESQALASEAQRTADRFLYFATGFFTSAKEALADAIASQNGAGAGLGVAPGTPGGNSGRGAYGGYDSFAHLPKFADEQECSFSIFHIVHNSPLAP